MELVRRGLQVSGRRPEQESRGQLCLTMRLKALAVVLVSTRALEVMRGGADLGDHAHDEALLFDTVRLYRVRILKNLAW
jgi:hypothetical protein